MRSATKPISKNAIELILFVIVLLAYLGLVLIDKDTHSAADVFSMRIVPGFIIYCIPTFAVCALLLKRFLKKYDSNKSLFLSASVGIPFTFGLIMASFYLFRYLGWMQHF